MSTSKENIAYGIHAVKSMLEFQAEQVTMVYIIRPKSKKDHQKDMANDRIKEIINMAKTSHIPISFISPSELNRSELGRVVTSDVVHQNVCITSLPVRKKKLDINEWIKENEDKDRSLILVLDQVTDPHNLGACLRTSDAVGADMIVLPKNNSASINPTVRKVAAGAAESANVAYVNNLARELERFQQAGYWVYGLSDKADKTIYEHEWPNKTVVIMGAEGSGMRRLVEENCDEVLSIPMMGAVESLNVSVATGVVLYEVNRQLNK